MDRLSHYWQYFNYETEKAIRVQSGSDKLEKF